VRHSASEEAAAQPESSRAAGPARDFAEYAEIELERRRSSAGPFDEALHRAAVELVLGKLRRRG
jgi:hypothetical protein